MDELPPILEFDPSRTAVIEPGRKRNDWVLAERCVMSFFGDVVEKYRSLPGTRLIGTSRWETGTVHFYQMEHRGKPVTFFHSWVGAPIVAGVMEVAIANGVRKIVACGGCGVLDKNIAQGHVLVPTSAVRDEGTSYHYLEPGREVVINASVLAATREALVAAEVPFLECKTWTTDGFFRETPDRVSRRKTEGCLAVEMECSAAAAVAEFRGVEFGQVLYSGDTLASEVYDDREWWKNVPVRERLFRLALDACVLM